MFKSGLWAASAALVAAAAFGGVLSAQAPARDARAAAAQATAAQVSLEEKIARGRYIVENVAVCGRCHTPVDATAQRDVTRWLRGGAHGYRSTVDISPDDWAIQAPRLAGGPPGTDETFIRQMMTGISRFGRPSRLPMPQFHMTQQDAESVLAYLKSLGAAPTLTR